MPNLPHILLLDNYDSFTFNLVQYIREEGNIEPEVVKNDQVNFADLDKYDGVILSPGPGLPAESGHLMEVIDHCKHLPMLGICLGHQAIGEYFGARLQRLENVYHGIDSTMIKTINNYFLFNKIKTRFVVGRYHSWIIEEQSLQNIPLEITCRDEVGNIMGIRHQSKNIHGVQFHPESIMTKDGRMMIRNFLGTAVKK